MRSVRHVGMDVDAEKIASYVLAIRGSEPVGGENDTQPAVSARKCFEGSKAARCRPALRKDASSSRFIGLTDMRTVCMVAAPGLIPSRPGTGRRRIDGMPGVLPDRCAAGI